MSSKTDLSAQKATASQYYRCKFREQLLKLAPSSLLDVGCGDGALMKRLERSGVTCLGVEPNSQLAKTCTNSGLSVIAAYAEHLPHGDNSVDVVASEYSLHHFSDMQIALSEKIRVARHTIAILDTGYDLSIPSQRTAYKFDQWLKEIDRSNDEIHNDALSAGSIIHSIGQSAERSTVSFEFWLNLEPLSNEKFDRLVETALAKAPSRASALAGLHSIRNEITRTGISEDGAIKILIHKTLRTESG